MAERRKSAVRPTLQVEFERAERMMRRAVKAEAELATLREAAEALLLSRKGWERWGEGGYLYDRHGGVGEGTVYSLPDALRKLVRP